MSEGKVPDCHYCNRPAAPDGSIVHRAGCIGLEDVRLTRLEHEYLVSQLAQAHEALRDADIVLEEWIELLKSNGLRHSAIDGEAARTKIAAALDRAALSQQDTQGKV